MTIPAGSSGKNLPAVVLPHGGPSARDEWGFDWLAQFVAARGYVVIQPNYRGSAGYGDDFLNENGFRNWQTSIADVGDAARYLVKEGIADKDRLAIVGWSYGGYAALQAAAIEPDLFKSVAAIAPVTDLDLLKSEVGRLHQQRPGQGLRRLGRHMSRTDRRCATPPRSRRRCCWSTATSTPMSGSTTASRWSARWPPAARSVTLLRYKGLDHQLEDSGARTEMLTKIGELLGRTIGN